MSSMSAKTRYIKLQSSTDRVQGDLNACTFDLTSATFLQNCKGAQLLGAGFTQLTPNVRADENTVVIQTNDTSIVVPVLPDTNINVDTVNFTIPPPPPGVYTPQEWADELSSNITDGIQNATSFDFSVEVTLTNTNPVTLSWDLAPVLTFATVTFDPTDAIAPLLGVTPARDRILGKSLQSYPGPLVTFPQGTFGTLHSFTVPESNYTITELIDALNLLAPPYPNILIPVWDFVDDFVTVSASGGLPADLRVISVIENRYSSLAPLLGYQNTDTSTFYTTQIAETQPGLYGLIRAYLHIRPIATGNTVTVSAGDQQALEVSVFGFIPCEDANYGDFVQYDFSRSGDAYTIRFEDDRDMSRLQVRLRDHQGRLITVGHPGIVLWLRVFLR
jgi:hypothetical protein